MRLTITFIIIIAIGCSILLLSKQYENKIDREQEQLLSNQKKAIESDSRKAAELVEEAIRAEKQAYQDSILNSFLNDINRDSLDLSDLGLEAIPYDLINAFPKLKYLNLSHNELSYVSKILELPKLIHLDLSYNKISEIEKIETVSRIEILDLRHNQIQYTPRIAAKYPRLKSLNLSYNAFKSITFYGFTNNSLEKLDISYNEIYLLDGIDGLSNLKEVRAIHCNFRELPNFNNNLKIKRLDFSHNDISELNLNPKQTNPLKELTNLSLNDNSISSVAKREEWQWLTALYLNGNNIYTLKVFKPFKQLVWLQVDDNALFGNLEINDEYSFWNLSLQGNKISSVDIKHKELIILNLSKMKSPIIFKKLETPKLQILYLQSVEIDSNNSMKSIKKINEAKQLEVIEADDSNFCELIRKSDLSLDFLTEITICR